MDVMQTLTDFKHNLQAHPAAKPGVSTPAASSSAKAPAATPNATASASSTAGSTTITANDFLQLLVAEMKNQDPTANQDPNAYIDQLVQVNSLQQLISINQDLTPPASSSTTGGTNPGLAPSKLGSADGEPSATVARSLTPPPAQPEKAPVSGGAARDGSFNGGLANGAPGPGLNFGPAPGPAGKFPSAAAPATSARAVDEERRGSLAVVVRRRVNLWEIQPQAE